MSFYIDVVEVAEFSGILALFCIIPDIRHARYRDSRLSGTWGRCFEATGPMANIAMIQQHGDLHRTQH